MVMVAVFVTTIVVNHPKMVMVMLVVLTIALCVIYKYIWLWIYAALPSILTFIVSVSGNGDSNGVSDVGSGEHDVGGYSAVCYGY